MATLADYRELRSAIADRRVGDGGADTSAALTATLDAAVAGLATGLDAGEAVVAVGGYGRGEQCLWSDVDVLILHRRSDPSPLVRAVLYPLWDANLKVGHAVRTVAECVAAARERFETLTNLLSARLVAGDPEATSELEAALARLLAGRPLTPTLASLERERRRRQPYPVMAADVKQGRGALRTFQGFWFERRRAALLGIAEHEETADERRARDDLLAIRNALHAATGRATDVFEFDLRDAVARWLEIDVMTAATRMCAALAEGDRLAARRWPDLLVDPRPMSRLRRRRGRAEPATTAEAPLPAVAAIACGSGPMALDRRTHHRLADTAVDRWSEADRSALVDLIGAGERGRVAFAWLEESGWVERNLPEWIAVVALPELAPFHEHPVDAHLWRTADEMVAITRSTDPLLAAVAADVGPSPPLLLAALLHDVGKGRGTDHAVAGADAASSLLRRAGFGPTVQVDVVPAVRNHLLLARTATRSDIADPDVLERVADAVGSRRALQILYLLTVADARATGRTMWSEWKAALLRELFLRVSARLSDPERAVDAIDPESVAAGREDFTAAEVAEHLAAMPPEYSMSLTDDEVRWHMEAIATVGTETTLLPAEDGRRVVIVGMDRRGFLLAVCRAFAACGVAILDARLNTRGDGVVVDVFEVRDDRSGGPVEAARWEQVRDVVTAVLDGRRDVRPLVAERSGAYPASSRAGVAVRSLPADAHRHTVIEVRAPDRIGLLAAIAESLHGEGLDVHLARIDTRGGEAVDTFHVRRLGVPIRTGPELSALLGRLHDRLASLLPP